MHMLKLSLSNNRETLNSSIGDKGSGETNYKTNNSNLLLVLRPKHI